MILTSDKRAIPVLAFSNQGYFNIKSKWFPSLLVEWLESQDEYIQVLRKDEYGDETIIVPEEATTEDIKDFITTSTNAPSKAGYNKRLNLTTQYGPLLETTWGQWDGFNNFTPHIGCNSSNRRAPSGCVATAMAQIMKLYEHPSTYNWSLMPNRVGSDETSRLIKDIGDAVNMIWDCNGSSAYMSDVPSAFTTDFNYKSVRLGRFSVINTFNELKKGYPVIFAGGGSKKSWISFNAYQGGHAWVCDGIRKYYGQIRGYDPRTRTTFHSIIKSWTYRMNWGWSGVYDGWFSSGWNVSNKSFNYNKEMVYKIRKE